MAGGLAALLDDIAAIARIAAASIDDIGAAAGRAGAKAAAVVVDDAAVTPKYVQGFSPQRELPVIWRIAKGSLLNKAVIIVLALLMSQFLPWLLTPLLMLGGCYLVFEGAEKILEWLRGSHPERAEAAVDQGPEHEKKMVSGAVRTDFILSAEIMVISLREVASETFWTRAAVLAVVAVAITALVYGVVGLIVKLDDIGLAMAKRESDTSKRVGELLVKAMPVILSLLSIVGTIAMLWVGGHILLVGMDELGFSAPYAFVHMLTDPIAEGVPALGGALAWLVDTLCSAVAGLIVGLVIVAILHPLLHRGHEKHEEADAEPAAEESAVAVSSPEERVDAFRADYATTHGRFDPTTDDAIERWWEVLDGLAARHGTPDFAIDPDSPGSPPMYTPDEGVITEVRTDGDKTIVELVRDQAPKHVWFTLVPSDGDWRLEHISRFVTHPKTRLMSIPELKERLAVAETAAPLPELGDEDRRDFSVFFEPTTVETGDGATQTTRIEWIASFIGDGVFAVGDFGFKLLQTTVVPCRAVAGEFEAHAVMLGDECAALTMTLSPRRAQSWHPAGRVAVDAGHVALFDASLAYDLNVTEVDEIYQEFLATGEPAGVLLSPLDHHPLGVITRSGAGDGEYPFYVGLDAAGTPVRLVVDYGLVPGAGREQTAV